MQAAAEKAGKAAKRLYVGNIPFDTSQNELISFFDTIMVDTNAVAADTEEQGSAVTSCTLSEPHPAMLASNTSGVALAHNSVVL